MKLFTKLKALMLISTVLSSKAAPLIKGNSTDVLQSFDFPLLAHSLSSRNADYKNNIFLVGARLAKSGNTFAVAAAMSQSDSFVPLAPQKITLNYREDQTNPLYGAAILFLDHMHTMPVVVAENSPNQIYLFLNYTNLHKISLLATMPLLDTFGNFSSGIVGLSAHTPYADSLQNSSIVYAFKNSTGQFGVPGSGIGTLQVVPVEITETVDNKEQKRTEFRFFARPLVPVDTTTNSLWINDALASIDNDTFAQPVAFATSRSGAVYAGFFVTGSPNPAAGARGVFLNGAQEIAPAAAFESDSIIGGTGPSTQVSIHRMKTMLTTTSLDYLIVQGGVGDPATTKSEVFALPLVLASGVLANKNSLPETVFSQFEPYTFKGRMFTQQALVQGDLPTPADPAARVGGTGVLPSDITDLQVVEDAVYVTTLAGDHQAAGTFYSRALFDEHGRIKDWTNWQRAGIQGNFFGLGVDHRTTAFWYLEGLDRDHLFTVRRTSWSEDRTGLARVVNNFFEASNYGVQGITDVPYTHPALDQTIGNRISVDIFTGNKKIMLTQSGMDHNNEFSASGFGNSFISQDGSLASFASSAEAIGITGGVLNEMGAVVTSALAYDNSNGWFAFGGNGGVAILARDDGTGFALPLQKNFSNFDSTLKIRRLSAQADVKKIIAQNNQLYVLTLTTLYRFDITPQAITNEQALTIVARASDLDVTYFNDFLVSGSYALLASSNGLWNTTSSSIMTAMGSEELLWTRIPLNEFPGSVTRLYAISPTEFETDFATRLGGNIIALAAYPGHRQARIYRLAVSAMQLPSVDLFPDYFIQNRPTFYATLGDYRNGLFSDGGLYLISESKYDQAQDIREVRQQRLPYLWALPGIGLDDRRFFAAHAVLQGPLNTILSHNVMARRSSDGGIMLAGDQGIRINE